MSKQPTSTANGQTKGENVWALKKTLAGLEVASGAPCRIRTYDALIRSQVLYPAEVTPRAVIYNAVPFPICQRGFLNMKEV